MDDNVLPGDSPLMIFVMGFLFVTSGDSKETVPAGARRTLMAVSPRSFSSKAISLWLYRNHCKLEELQPTFLILLRASPDRSI
jgi:hypothetical protein